MKKARCLQRVIRSATTPPPNPRVSLVSALRGSLCEGARKKKNARTYSSRIMSAVNCVGERISFIGDIFVYVFCMTQI